MVKLCTIAIFKFIVITRKKSLVLPLETCWESFVYCVHLTKSVGNYQPICHDN